jgi:hypothetical protein
MGQQTNIKAKYLSKFNTYLPAQIIKKLYLFALQEDKKVYILVNEIFTDYFAKRK